MKYAIRIAAFAAAGWVFWLCLGGSAARWVWAPLLAGTIVGALGYGLTARYCTCLSSDCATLASLFPYVEKPSPPPMTRDRVAAKVKTLVIDQLGLRDGQYREDAEFVRDLGLD